MAARKQGVIWCERQKTRIGNRPKTLGFSDFFSACWSGYLWQLARVELSSMVRVCFVRSTRFRAMVTKQRKDLKLAMKADIIRTVQAGESTPQRQSKFLAKFLSAILRIKPDLTTTTTLPRPGRSEGCRVKRLCCSAPDGRCSDIDNDGAESWNLESCWHSHALFRITQRHTCSRVLMTMCRLWKISPMPKKRTLL